MGPSTACSGLLSFLVRAALPGPVVLSRSATIHSIPGSSLSPSGCLHMRWSAASCQGESRADSIGARDTRCVQAGHRRKSWSLMPLHRWLHNV